MNKQVIIDGDRTPKEPIIGENKSGSKTLNGRSEKQLSYRFKRKYGEKNFEEIMGSLDENPAKK